MLNFSMLLSAEPKSGNQVELSSTVNLTPRKLKRSRGKGFTLAEILITLTVIGVVAALTIPTLLQNTQQAELKTALKRDFADLSQATLLIKNDAGGTLVNAFRNGAGDGLDSENLKNAYKGKLNYIKECSGTAAYGGSGTGASGEGGCWHGTNNWELLNSTKNLGSQNPGLILNNGTLMFFGLEKSDCMLDLSFTGGAVTYKRCAAITIDVNGFKKPNVLGKDIFQFSLTSDSLIPAGAQGFFVPEITCIPGSTDSGNNGYGCTAKYLYE